MPTITIIKQTFLGEITECIVNGMHMTQDENGEWIDDDGYFCDYDDRFIEPNNWFDEQEKKEDERLTDEQVEALEELDDNLFEFRFEQIAASASYDLAFYQK